MPANAFAPALDGQVEAVLRRLKINGTVKGLRYLIYTITETVRDPARTELITKDLYRETARLFQVSPGSVERAIRTAIEISWAEAREEFDRIAGYHLIERPSNSRFIDLVAYYIRCAQ